MIPLLAFEMCQHLNSFRFHFVCSIEQDCHCQQWTLHILKPYISFFQNRTCVFLPVLVLDCSLKRSAVDSKHFLWLPSRTAPQSKSDYWQISSMGCKGLKSEQKLEFLLSLRPSRFIIILSPPSALKNVWKKVWSCYELPKWDKIKLVC